MMRSLRFLPFEVRTPRQVDGPVAAYRCGEVVEVVLTCSDPEVRKRLVDFFAGVAFAMEGRILVLGPTRFQLLPRDVDHDPDWSLYHHDVAMAGSSPLAGRSPTGRLMGQLFG
jgi:hypothetical protein